MKKAKDPASSSPHGIAVDSHGDIYVAEVSHTIRGRRMTPPRELRSISTTAASHKCGMRKVANLCTADLKSRRMRNDVLLRTPHLTRRQYCLWS
jgi:hypothetical protein